MSAAENIARWREHPSAMVRELFEVEPDPWQEDGLEAFPRHPRLAMKACKGPGKAQPKQTLIPTPTGLRTLGSLKVGDEIFAGDGSITQIRAVYDRGVLPIYRVTFDDMSSTEACGEHLWKVRGRTERRHKTWSILTTEQIIARGVREKNGRWAGRHFEIPRQGSVQYPRQDFLPLDPYVLGVWLGDGVRLNGRYATKPTNEIEQEIQRRGYRTSGARDGLVYVYGIIDTLRGLGILGAYSHERSVPAPFMYGSIDQRTDLICGLMDTDGGIDRDGHMEFSSTSEQLAAQVVCLVRSLGGVAFIKPTIKWPFYYNQKREKIAGRPCYRVTVRLPFNPFRVPHRRDRWTDPMRSPSTERYITRKIDAIDPAGEADCACIEIEHPDQLYLTNDFIVTHNTALLAWLGWNFLLTRPHPMIGCTSIDAKNLKTNLWTELARWYAKAPLLQHLFEITSERIFCREHPQTWKMEARTWPKDADATQIGNALAGVHAAYVMWLLDETGDYPDAIMPTCEGIFAGDPIEAHIVQAGNPTRLAGPLYRAFTIAANLWYKVEITADPDDPKRTSRVSVEHALEQIAQYGRENPWVLVNIFGKFPPASFNALIGPDEVRASFKRYYRDFELGDAARILGVDVARYGDDASVIANRRGLQMWPFKKYRNIDSTQGAFQVAQEWDKHEADACFIDMTGGFGSGWFDQLLTINRTPIGVEFAAKAHQDERYFNKRAEMALDFVDWIKRGGGLPEDDRLLAALTQTTYTLKGNRFLLEPKEIVKEKIGYSPDEFDASILTFAEPVAPKNAKRRVAPVQQKAYDPFADFDKLIAGQRDERSYDPFA